MAARSKASVCDRSLAWGRGLDSRRGHGCLSVVCCAGRGLCDGLITRPEESYRLRCVVVCDLEKPQDEEGVACDWAVSAIGTIIVYNLPQPNSICRLAVLCEQPAGSITKNIKLD